MGFAGPGSKGGVVNKYFTKLAIRSEPMHGLRQFQREFLIKPLLVFSLFACAPLAMAQTDIETLQALNRAGRTADALALANQMLPLREGEPAFDLEYGVAAVDTGIVSEGIFALERVIMNQLSNLYARLELARAYFAAGEDDRAKAEFDRVLATNPPQDVRDNVRPYLDTISAERGSAEVSGAAVST